MLGPAQQQAVDEAEHRGIGADAEGDDQSHDRHHAGLGGERAPGVAHVLPQAVEPVAQAQAPLAAARCPQQTGARLGQRAEAAQRLGARRLGAQPLALEHPRALLEVRGDLLVDLGSHLAGAAQAEVEEAADAGADHGRPLLMPARRRGSR